MKSEKLQETFQSYRDEMNFAEFPLALLDRPYDGQKTIEFSDTIWDSGRKLPVTRKLTISASDKFGLPTPLDEEVILGLIQLSHQANFDERRVHFTKGQLVRLLGWSDDGRSYKRISEAMHKWLGITLYWEKAWWSKKDSCWVDESFHILDNVTLLDKERYLRQVESATSDPTAGMCSFVWNEKVFESFKAGYIKKLDLEFWKGLHSVISKKMYRFLDKRFWNDPSLKFNLRVFACEHIGLSRNYHTGEIKRRLRPAIAELEEKGFLRKLSDEQRFVKESRGVWSIHFQKQRTRDYESISGEDVITKELTLRGISPKVAGELSSKYSPTSIQEKINFFDTLLRNGDKRVSKNPPGFLVSSIRNDFTTSVETRRLKISKPTKTPTPSTEPIISPEDIAQREALQNFTTWFSSLTQEQRDQFESEAVSKADVFSSRNYRESKHSSGHLFKAVREKILLNHFHATYQTPICA